MTAWTVLGFDAEELTVRLLNEFAARRTDILECR